MDNESIKRVEYRGNHPRSSNRSYDIESPDYHELGASCCGNEFSISEAQRSLDENIESDIDGITDEKIKLFWLGYYGVPK